MAESANPAYQRVSSLFRTLAQRYVALKRPTVIAVAGSVGKTSTKLMLAHLLQSRRVSYMDDSYNNGLGLYLSVFELKVPTNLTSKVAWGFKLLQALMKFALPGPKILIVEYGIDHPGDMDEMINFIQPDISILTAVTPEHMEYMKTLDGVASEETKILTGTTHFAVYNHDNIKPGYVPTDVKHLYSYGSKSSLDASYTIESWKKDGAIVTMQLNSVTISGIKVNFVTEALIRQLTGAAFIAHLLDIPKGVLRQQLETATPAASRMHVFDGVNGSTIIDDAVNFSPDAGIESLRSLKRLPAKRHIAILGNMHELGDYADKGFSDVATEFKDIDILALVGDLSIEKFGALAKEQGFKTGENLLTYDTSVDAGIDFRDKVKEGDIVLVKGPFGGWYLEEAVKKLLANPTDSALLTRQSKFWQQKKQELFGDKYLQ